MPEEFHGCALRYTHTHTRTNGLFYFLSLPFSSPTPSPPLAAKYLPGAGSSGSSKGCCSDASCTDGEGSVTGDVETIKSMQRWEDLKR